MTDTNIRRDYWPTNGWHITTPEEQGIDSELLARACDLITENKLHIHSMLVVRHGYLVADAYFYPYTPNTLHDLASCTKSFTSTLIGIAIDRGNIKSVKQPVLELLQGRDVANVDARKEAMTLEHLLTMSTGMVCYNEPGEITLMEMCQSQDWTRFTLDLPMIEPPGTRFEYCSPASYLLSVIIQEATGMTTLDFARRYLFEPLGITDVIWPVSPQGINHGWGDLHLTPHDMAKLGYLYLNNGQWDGKQVLSTEWIKAATRKHTTPPQSYGYGYQWWLVSLEIYSAQGRGGQLIIVVPDLDIVVVFTGGLNDEEDLKREEIIQSFLVPAIKPTIPLPANPDGVALLESKIHQATLPEGEPETAPPLPAMAKKISGLIYELDANWLGLKVFSLTFSQQEEALLNLSTEELTLELKVGLDNIFRITSGGRFNLPTALKGAWETDHVFILKWDEIGNINNWQAIITFENDKVTMQWSEATGLDSVTINGYLRR